MAALLSDAIKKIPSLADNLKPGLQALRRNDRNAVSIEDSRKLSGSIDIDKALESEYPNENRWDYCIGVRRTTHSDSIVWVEVHPANSRSVSDMLAKAKWLKSWLTSSGKPLRVLCPGRLDLRWVPTGRVGFPRGSRQSKSLAQAGIGFPERRIVLD